MCNEPDGPQLLVMTKKKKKQFEINHTQEDQVK